MVQVVSPFQMPDKTPSFNTSRSLFEAFKWRPHLPRGYFNANNLDYTVLKSRYLFRSTQFNTTYTLSECELWEKFKKTELPEAETEREKDD